ncbi:sulfurtransferase complex subunit TusC, partial [Buchnera aphidicola]|nr:sulfurtransferase complex subunit TusC [Buchnera aphidicola]
MKMIAVVFSHSPHGTSFGREGLDLILGISALIKKISVFFIGDGVFQLLQGDNVERILSRNYIPAF